MDVKKFALIMLPIIVVILIIDIIFFREYFSYLLPTDFFTKRQRKIERVVRETERTALRGPAVKTRKRKKQEQKVEKKKIQRFKKIEVPVIQSDRWTYPASPLFAFLELEAKRQISQLPNPFRVEVKEEKEEELIPQLELKAILSSPDGRFANINGKIVREGDEVFGAKVVKIYENQVLLSVQNRIVRLKIAEVLSPEGTIIIGPPSKEEIKEGTIKIEIVR